LPATLLAIAAGLPTVSAVPGNLNKWFADFSAKSGMIALLAH